MEASFRVSGRSCKAECLEKGLGIFLMTPPASFYIYIYININININK